MTNKHAVEMNRLRWKGTTKAERTAHARMIALRRWHQGDCELLRGDAECYCAQRRRASQVPTSGDNPEGQRS